PAEEEAAPEQEEQAAPAVQEARVDSAAPAEQEEQGEATAPGRAGPAQRGAGAKAAARTERPSVALEPAAARPGAQPMAWRPAGGAGGGTADGAASSRAPSSPCSASWARSSPSTRAMFASASG